MRSFDHPIDAQEDELRDGESDLARNAQIDGEFVFRILLDRKFRRVGALEDPGHIQHQIGLETTLLGLEPLEQYGTVTISEGLTWYAEMLLLSGQDSQAVICADKALSRLRLGGFSGAARARRVRAIAKSNSQDTKWNWIRSEMDESLAIAISRKLLPETAVTHFRYAELLRAGDDFEQARIHVRAASDLFADMNMTWWSEQAAKLKSTLLN